jgi:hypothetical protein
MQIVASAAEAGRRASHCRPSKLGDRIRDWLSRRRVGQWQPASCVGDGIVDALR